MAIGFATRKSQGSILVRTMARKANPDPKAEPDSDTHSGPNANPDAKTKPDPAACGHGRTVTYSPVTRHQQRPDL